MTTIKKRLEERRSAGESEVEIITSGPVEKRRGGTRLEVSEVPTLAFINLGGLLAESPPFDIDDWALAPEISTRLAACIFIRSQNVSLGYDVVPKERYQRKISRSRKEMTDAEREDIDELQKTIEHEKDTVDAFLEKPNPKKSFVAILRACVADREAIGNGWMVVKRAMVSTEHHKAGAPILLGRLVGHTVRIKKVGGYVAKNKKGKWIHYKEWGDTRLIDNRTGKVHKKEDGYLHPKNQAKELIHFKVESFRNTDYGVPRHLSTSPAIAGNRFAAERNASFFENDATPRLAIVVTGPYRLSKDSRSDIKDFIERKGKGSKNTGRVMIIQAGTREGSLTEKEDVKIEFHKLTVGVSEEGSYLKYQGRTDSEIAEAFGIHPVYFEKDAARASANIGRSITLEQTFEPDIIDLEYLLNNTIIEALGVTHVWLRLKRPRVVDFEGQATILKKLERTGGITPNLVRDFLNKPRFKEGWADVPLPLAMQQLKVPEGRVKGSKLISGLINLNDIVENEIKKRIEKGEETDARI